MSVKLPQQAEAFAFIAGSHDVDRLKCGHGDILATYQGRGYSPYADGHLKALNHLFSRLLDKDDFPARDIRSLTNRFKSDMALAWLRDLHSIMLTPLLTHAPTQQTDDSANPPPKRNQVGVYRTTIASNSFSMCPSPELVPKILHNWLLDITSLHAEVKPKLTSAFGITKEKAHELEQKTYESLLLLSTVQPFPLANNRLGRLIENALRLQWRLPWKVTQRNDKYDKYIEDLVEYQTKVLPKLIGAAKDTRTF